MVRILAALGLAAALFAGRAATGQEARKFDYSDTVTVVEVAPGKQQLVVQEDTGRSFTLRIDDKTAIRSGAESVAARDLVPGDRVAIDARREGAKPEGQLVADRIEVVVDEPPGGKAAPDDDIIAEDPAASPPPRGE
jgi:hypothetical protein